MPEMILSLKGRELSRHALGPRARIGRDPDSEIVIDNVGVSRHHATVIQDASGFVVHDQGSRNGVFVNGQRVTQAVLRDGDVVQLGKFSLKLNMSGSGSTPPVSAENRSLPPRDVMKTVGMSSVEVQKLIAAQQALRAHPPRGEQADNSLKILFVGLLIIALLATAAWFVLLR